MSALDERARATAQRLINKFGRDVVYVRVTKGSYVPGQGKPSGASENSYSVRVAVQSLEAKGDTAVKLGDVSLTLAAPAVSFEPSINDRVVMDSGVYTMIGYKPVYSGEQVAIYELHMRKT